MFALKAAMFLVSLLGLSSAYTVDPPTTAPSDTIKDCTAWVVVAATDTCAALASDNSITLAQFNQYNPSTASKCVLITGDSYCTEQHFGLPPVSTSTSTIITTTRISTPGPIQTGMISNCNKFYLVKSGDRYVQYTAFACRHVTNNRRRCPDIASSNGISLANFYAWNPAVGSDCNFLIGSDYVCVGIIGGTTLTTSTKSGNGSEHPSFYFPYSYFLYLAIYQALSTNTK